MLLMEGLLNAFLAPGIRGIADASLLTVCTAPFLWWLVVLPLRRSALIERSKSDALQQQMVDAVVTCDARGVVGSLNPAALRTFGYREDEIIGQDVSFLLPQSEEANPYLNGSTAAASGGGSA